jgi:creatinine amidohydrolase
MGYSIFDETMVDLSWPEIEAAIKQNAIVLLPIGVIEEHGPHMGLGVDTYAIYMIAKLTKVELELRHIRTLIAPPFYWGINGLTSSFPGSFNVRPDTMKAVLLDTMGSLKNWGVRNVFAINWHGEGKHTAVILEAVKESRNVSGINAYCIVTDTQARGFRLSGKEEYVVIEGTSPPAGPPSNYLDLHAGSGETAVMLNYFPQQVNLEMAKILEPTNITFEDLKALRKGGDAAREMIPLGYFGNPAGFDLEAGKREIGEKALHYANLIESVVKGEYKPPEIT